MTPFDLTTVGLSGGIIQIEGTARVVHLEPSAKLVVFMFDEHHSLPPINDNIASGDAIIAAVRIGAIGVESHKFPFPVTKASTPINKFPHFAMHFVNKGLPVFGVEEENVFTDMESDLGVNLWPSADTHPYNFLRSCYFLSGLTRLRRDNRLTDHIFLNAGKKHIDHIEAVIRGGAIKEFSGEAASYVRINPTSYPTVSGSSSGMGS